MPVQPEARSSLRRYALAVVVLALAWHLASLALAVVPELMDPGSSRDFASYHAAASVAWAGGDPYDPGALAALDAYARTVHPFFYPPPFLLVVAWAPSLPPLDAYRWWVGLGELAFLVAAWGLWRHGARQDPTGAAVGLLLATSASCVVNNLVMGQANLLVLAVALAGVWLAEKRPMWGGAVVGLAAMLKIVPGVFVLWWAVQRRWGAVGGAIAGGLAASAVAVGVFGLAPTLAFWTDRLPGLGAGEWRGLTVPIGLFGNHSVTQLLHHLAPPDVLDGQARPVVRLAGQLMGLAGVAGTAWMVRGGRGLDAAAAVAASVLWLGPYTWEHHLVWLLPAGFATALAVIDGRLRGPLLVAVVLAWGGWVVDLQALKLWATALQRTGLHGVAWGLQESKTAAWLVMWLAAAALARARLRPTG